MATLQLDPGIAEYLRKRLMPVEGAIHTSLGQTCSATPSRLGAWEATSFEYINFQQRYNIDARIAAALKRAKDYLEPMPDGQAVRSSVDDHVRWLPESRRGFAASDSGRVQKGKKLGATEDR